MINLKTTEFEGCEHMNPITVLHSTSREYVYPVGRNKLNIKLICSRGQKVTCQIVFWNRFHENEVKTEEMKCAGRDAEFDYFMCELAFNEAVKYLRYYFIINVVSGREYLGRDGLSREKPKVYFEYLYTNEEDIMCVPKWAEGAVIYQIFPERFNNGDTSNDWIDTVDWNSAPTRGNFFGGDLRGIIMKMDYLQELGVDAVYLNPLFKSPSNHKYDTIDYYSIDPSFGDTDDLIELVTECHKRNIKIIIDGVFNHCGFYFEPFQDVLEKGEKSEFKDWFYIESFPVQTDPPNYECVGYYKLMPKLRFKNNKVRSYFIDVGTYWLKTAGIDGWRLDVADEVDFTFWQEFRRAIKGIKEDAILIGETWKDGRDMLRGDQMDSVMNYLFRDAVVGYFARDEIDSWQFDHLIQRMLSIYPDVVYPVLYNLIGSHDTPRFLELCKGNVLKMQLAVAFQMTFPGMPAVYYGDETGLTGENDPGCRKAMNWENYDQKLLTFYKSMIAIRKESPSLMYGNYRTICCDDGVYGYARQFGMETAYVIINKSNTEKQMTIPLFEDVSNSHELKSVLNRTTYRPKEIRTGDCYYNSDINDYRSSFQLVLPAYHFEIIKTGRKQT